MPRDHLHDELVMSILAKARRLTERERASYLGLACKDDKELRQEVAEALEWEERMGGFLQESILSTPAVSRSFAVGDVLAQRFEIVREIGEGGMGVVYEAFDRKRDQRIALKAAKPGFEHFLSPELGNALKLRHPNICLVNEIHTGHDGVREFDFLTMELLDGRTLSLHLADRGSLSIPEAADVARQLCAGLKEAHDNGVIHGDLKTGNVILCQGPSSQLRAVITDFGLSGEEGTSGQLRGTPGYIAPEMWQGAPPSPASDIYALGLILHQLVVSEEDVSRAYRELVDSFISIDPTRRVEAFAAAPDTLRKIAPARPRPSRRRLLTAAASFATAGAGVLWLGWARERAWIENAVHPLPMKRFIVIWTAAPRDSRAEQYLSSAMEAVEDDLVRAEGADPNLYVIGPPESHAQEIDSNALNAARDSLGANLLLTASCDLRADGARLSLVLRDVPSGRPLRTAQVTAPGDMKTLQARTVRAAAHLLNVRGERATPRISVTDSPAAFRAFQAGKTDMNRRNDGGLESAIQEFSSAVEADPRYSLAHAELARAYCRLYAIRGGDNVLELARANATRAIALSGNLPEAHTALAFVQQSKGDKKGALAEIAQALILDPSNPKTLVWQAQIYTRFHEWDKAEKTYLRLQKERPNFWLAYQERGVLLNLQGRNAEALESFRTATILAPWSGLAFSNLGMLLLKMRKVSESLISFQKSLLLNPRDDGTYLSYSQALCAAGRFKDALSASRNAVALNADEDENWLGLGDCCQRIAGKQTEAKQCYATAAEKVEHALRTDPSDGAKWLRLALYRAKLHPKISEQAILRKVEVLGAEDADSRILKARVLMAYGRRDEGFAMLPAWLRNGATSFECSFVPELRGSSPQAQSLPAQ